MNSTRLEQAAVTSNDRFSLTLSIAILTHAIFILGITFTLEEEPEPRFNVMEIVLVQQQSKAPEKAELLAQASLEGGGKDEEKLHPETLTAPSFPDDSAAITAVPNQDPLSEPTNIATDNNTEGSPPDTPESVEQLAIEDESANTYQQDHAQAQDTRADDQLADQEKTTPLPTPPSAARLLTNSLKIASLSAEIRRKLKARSKLSRQKFISASTKEDKYVAYMAAWRSRIEHVGNLYYPELARKQNLSGNLMLDVAINSDGSINGITIRRSSGHKILDQTAIQIANSAAPYAPLPEAIRREADILHILRTWLFTNNSMTAIN